MKRKEIIFSLEPRKNPSGWSIILGFLLLFFSQQGYALTVIDSTVNSKAVYVVTWTDNDGKPRKMSLVKDADQTYVGVSQFISYYDGTTKINITSPFPTNPSAHNTGFGATVHHQKGTGSSAFHNNGGTFTLTFQGDHHAIFDRVQTISGAVETITYTFMDGHDYFQWQETLDATNGTLDGDSRGPYCTMMWDGVDFSAVTGQEYGAKKYFSQPSYNGPWTFTGTCDIPYVKQWDNGREIGYVQTQTFTQQLAGNPTWDASLNLSAGAATIDATNATPTSGDDAWAFDYQMNFYDYAKKITWGLPYGYMKGDDANSGTKNKWGQYSLSIVFDALTEDGVLRVRNENRSIHAGNVSLTALIGSIETTGRVGTANPATQTLSPAGYDHNYRTWLVSANASEQVELHINISGGAVLQHPTFRIKNMTALPTSVIYNNTAITSGTDYYASYYSALGEVWLTLKRTVSSNAALGVNVLSTGMSSNSGVLDAGAYSIYPNPVGNSVHVSLEGISGNVKLIVRNQLGITMEELESEATSFNRNYEIVLNNLTSGIYYVEIISPKGNAMEKIVKQ